MSQNCENLDLGYLSEAPVGAPRMHFYQRIWVPPSEKLNDFNRRLLTQNASDFQQICMADQLQCDAFDAVATSSENRMLSETIYIFATMLFATLRRIGICLSHPKIPVPKPFGCLS